MTTETQDQEGGVGRISARDTQYAFITHRSYPARPPVRHPIISCCMLCCAATQQQQQEEYRPLHTTVDASSPFHSIHRPLSRLLVRLDSANSQRRGESSKKKEHENGLTLTRSLTCVSHAEKKHLSAAGSLCISHSLGSGKHYGNAIFRLMHANCFSSRSSILSRLSHSLSLSVVKH